MTARSRALGGVLGGAAIAQTAYVVEDLEAACRRWHGVHGIGPFVGSGGFMLPMTYRGESVEVELAAVFVQAGEGVVELVQQLNDAPSPFRQLFPKGREGLHHVAVFCDDYAATRDRAQVAGLEVAAEFDYVPGCRICFIDTTPSLGHMVELYTDHPALRDMYAATRAAAETWDGVDIMAYG